MNLGSICISGLRDSYFFPFKYSHITRPLFKRKLILAQAPILFILVFAFCFRTVQAAEASLAAELTKNKTALLSLVSYDCQGFLTINHTDELVGFLNGSSEEFQNKNTSEAMRFRFRVRAKGPYIRLDVDELSESNEPIRSEQYYVGPNYYAFFDSRVASASITTTDVSNVVSGINDWLPCFVEYTFLRGDSPDPVFGIKPITISMLTDVQLWGVAEKNIIDGLKKHDDKLVSVIKTDNGHLEISFSSLTNNFKALVPSGLKAYNNAGQITRSISISGFQEILHGFWMGKNVKISTYQPIDGKPSMHFADWQFTITSYEINELLDDSVFEFDPSVASKIWDADHKTTITVPK